MPATQDDNWRVTFMAQAGHRGQVERMARIFTDKVDPLDPRTVMCYFDTEVRAREALSGQLDEAVAGFTLARWDQRVQSWTVVDRDGAAIPDSGGILTGSSSVKDFVFGTLLWFALGFVVLFLATYFIPGASGTPDAGRHHDLGRALEVGVIGAVVVVWFVNFRQRR
jgi:hypothetical protein